MRIPLAVPLALLALAAPATAAPRPDPYGEAALQKKLAGLVPGKPVTCIQQLPSNQSETYNGAVVYHVAGTTYVNRFGGTCNARPGFDILVTSTPITQICRGDSAQVVDQAARFPRGVCIYDTWESYTRPKKAK